MKTLVKRNGARTVVLAALANPLFGCGGEDRSSDATTGAGSGGATSSSSSSSSAATGSTTTASTSASGGSNRTFKAEAWADNWFQAYVGEALVAEDSVSITTTKSFNSETFTFEASYPFTMSFVLKDYVENDSGLEYIGTPKQQIGDGGFVFQLTDTTAGTFALVSNSSWKCLAIHRAPLNPTCVSSSDPLTACTFEKLPVPDGWHAPTFDDGAWPAAVVFTAAEVGPKEGYLDVTWSPDAAFLWSADLKLDNTVLCRVTLDAP